MHEGHSALQLQHLHHHAVTLCWQPLIHAQAQGRVLALEGKMGTERDVADESGPFGSTGSFPTTLSQAKARHTTVPTQGLWT